MPEKLQSRFRGIYRKNADSVTVKDDGGKIFVSYLSPDIGGGKHDVEIKCKGKTAIDSVVIFN